jgi:EAL domain-containing protein (putative c-di-GMP-specific phosphodiesterase class I)
VTLRGDVRSTVQCILDLGGFRPAFQPIVGLSDGRIAGVEALMRFEPAPYEPPDVWFGRAHACGLGVALEAAAVTRVLRILRLLPPTVYVSINATPAFAGSPEFSTLLGQGQGHGPAPLGRLVLELSEHAAVEDYQALIAVLAPLRDRGLRVAVDNAGGGYATSDHIALLGPDMIKVDAGSTATRPGERSWPRWRGSGRSCRATVTAEGVETPQDLATVTDLGFHAAQGFLLARPTASPAVWRAWGTDGRLLARAASGGAPGAVARRRPA